MKKITALLIGLSISCNAFGASRLINGAGATFPYPIYSKWFDEYSKIKPDVRFNYQSIGSGGGIKQILAKTVDFGATDGPMTDEQLKEAPGRIFHIPMVIGTVVVAYNLPGLPKGLKLSPEILAEIYLGKITKWTDEKIQSINPELTLPDLPVVVIRRSDGSGTTYIFVDYLCAISGEWKLKIGKGTSVNWPVGLGGKGNEGVAGLVKQTPGAIGYMELSYAVSNSLGYAYLKNQAGNFVEPTLESSSKAADGVAIPSDFRVSLVNSSNPDAYPIAGFTWLLIYKNPDDAQKGSEIVAFIKWAIRDGQSFVKPLSYAPLPQNVVEMVEKKLEDVKTS